MSAAPFPDLNSLATYLRQQLQNVAEPKKFILLYAYNGTGQNTAVHGLQRSRQKW